MKKSNATLKRRLWLLSLPVALFALLYIYTHFLNVRVNLGHLSSTPESHKLIYRSFASAVEENPYAWRITISWEEGTSLLQFQYDRLAHTVAWGIPPIKRCNSVSEVQVRRGLKRAMESERYPPFFDFWFSMGCV